MYLWICCSEFIRVPGHSDNPRATTRGLTASYHADELGDIPLAAQLMGSNTDLLAAAAARLVAVKGAPRIDLNCGQWVETQSSQQQPHVSSTESLPFWCTSC